VLIKTLKNAMSLERYIKLNDLGGEFAEMYFNVREGIPCSAFGVQFSQKCHFASALDAPVLYVTSTAVGAKQAAEEISELCDKRVVYLGAKDDVLLFKRSFNKESLYSRLTALYRIKQGADIVVTTFEALLQLFPSKIEAVTVEEGKEYRISFVTAELARLGYRRVDAVEGKGTFSVRGDILDVFPINEEEPLRVDFFGDEVESISRFTPSTGLKGQRVRSLDAVMATDVIIESGERAELLSVLKESYRKCVKNVVFTKAKTIYSELVTAIEAGGSDDCLQFLLPVIKNVTDDIFSFVSEDSIVVMDECKLLKENIDMLQKEHAERVAHFLRTGEAFDFT